MAITSDKLLYYCKNQLGRPYWYGTFGQIGTPTLYSQKAAQYPSQYNKWDKKTFIDQFGQRVHDCVGLIKGAVWSDGDPNATPKYNQAQDVSANGLIKLCTEQGPIKDIPEIPGLIVWKDSHVGVYIGDGYCIEAKGHAYGVVKSKVADRPFTKWGKLPPSFVTYTERPKKCSVTLPVLYKNSTGEAVKSLQALLDVQGYGLQIDGAYGSKTETAVKDFKKKNGLGSTDEVNTYTWSYLLT